MQKLSNFFQKENELINACRILYGPDMNIDGQFLRLLQQKELKSAYRRCALATHPDRFLAHGNYSQKHTMELFVEVSQAYEKLNSYLHQRTLPPSSIFSSSRSKSPWGAKGFSWQDHRRPDHRQYDSKWKKPFTYPGQGKYSEVTLPGWRLKLGEYLLYSRIISWDDLISALIWQKNCRPKVGEIALRWRWLSPRQLHQFLRIKLRGEKTGEVLLRYGQITSFQQAMLLRYQSDCQPLIGQYFVHTGLMDQIKIRQHLKNLVHHNVSLLPK